MGVGFTILSKLVRNDAMKIDPPEIYNMRVSRPEGTAYPRVVEET